MSDLTPRKLKCPPLRFVGVTVRTRNADEMNPATARIPTLWQRFYRDGIAQHIPARQDQDGAYGVYFDYAGERHGDYSVLAGCTVDVSARRDGLHTVVTTHADYLVFPAQGPMPQAIVETWQRIGDYFERNPTPTRAYTVDFERYDLTDAQHADIYIAVSTK